MPNIAANEDTFKYRDSSSGVTVGVSSMTGADYNPYVGFDTSKSKSDGTAYTNASLVAGGNIVTYSGRDTNIAGANFLAGEILSMDVGRALNVATLQNSMQSKSYSASVTIGKSGSTGFSGSYGEGDRKFADNQTTLIGREGVSVNVKGETTMFGSLIANIDTNGIDQGNLVLNTAKLNAFDLVNTDDNWHIAIGTSFAGDDGKAVNGSQQSGTWKHTATGAVGYQDVDGVTRATVGAGAIVVGSGDLRTLNRDVTKVNEITKMESSQGEITVPVPASVAEPVRDGTVQVATVAGKTVYYVSPVYASRVINENNDQIGKAPNPAPHFIPGLGLTESETGKDFEKDQSGKDIVPEFWKSFASGTKANPILKGMYHIIPGFPSNSGFHDAGMEWMGDPNGFVKAVTIPPYFAYNYYGAAGTLMDVPNYNTNFTEIRNSVIGNINAPQK